MLLPSSGTHWPRCQVNLAEASRIFHVSPLKQLTTECQVPGLTEGKRWKWKLLEMFSSDLKLQTGLQQLSGLLLASVLPQSEVLPDPQSIGLVESM